jgi:predicted nucleic acid-binding protein
LAFFSASDDNHDQADALFRRAVVHRTRLYTTNLVLAEVHRLLLFRAGRPAATAALARIGSSAAVSIVFATAEHHEVALAWLGKLHDQDITYTDATSFAVMTGACCQTAIAFDADFWTAGFSPWQG